MSRVSVALIQMLVPGFTVRELPVDITNINNVEYDARGQLIALGYDGRLHRLDDTDGDGLEDRVRPYWYESQADLRAPIGMAVAPGGAGVYVASKGKISLFRDRDGDGAADGSETVASGWPEIDHGIDAVGLTLGSDGSLYFGLARGSNSPYPIDADGRISNEGVSRYDFRGERNTIMRVSPDRKRREVYCTGVRASVGMAFNRNGDLFATDQEGETWCPGGNPLDELLHILPGKHYGFPPRHPKWLPDVIDEPAVVTFSPQHQSACGLKFNEQRAGRRSFGPDFWEGDALVAGESRGKIWRVPLVKTDGGYLGRPVLIATASLLVVDLAVSPRGDLVVSAHSGPPDWGLGPKGRGHLFKIRHADPAVPQPIAAWSGGATEVRVTFDRPIDASRIASVAIEHGDHVRPGDRFEALKPSYKVVRDVEMRAPRRTLGVTGRALSTDGRTLLLTTRPHPWRTQYAVTLSGVGADIDVAYDLSGLSAAWTPRGARRPAWEGWVPHLDPAVTFGLLRGSAEHQSLRSALDRPGKLVLRARLAAAGERARLRLRSTGKLTATWGSQRKSSPVRGRAGAEVVLTSLASGRPEPLTVEVETGGHPSPFGLSALVRSGDDPTFRPVRLEHLIVPWAPDAVPPKIETSGEADRVGSGRLCRTRTIAGGHGDPVRVPAFKGNWHRGRKIFFEEARCSLCHSVRGEGASRAPDLSNLTAGDPVAILRDIVEPNAAINPDFIPYSLKLRDGRELTGLVRGRSLGAKGGAGKEDLLVLDGSGQETAVKGDDVVDMRAQEVSIMPEGFKDLGRDKLEDLLTFLTHRSPP